MLTPAANDQAINTRYIGTLAIMKSPKALRSDATTSGNMVYPSIETDCMIELPALVDALIGYVEHSHVAAQQLDLKRDNSFANPDQGEDA